MLILQGITENVYVMCIPIVSKFSQNWIEIGTVVKE